MGFIQAFKGALSGTFADQWKDFYLPRSDVKDTAGVFAAVPKGTNSGRGENTKGYDNIITNGSKIIVPEGTALITMQDGAVTGCIVEAGGYEFRSDDPNSKSLFAGDGILASTLKSSWEKVKFGGQPGSQQLAFYVNMKPIPNNKFGTQSEIYWDDAFLNTQVGALVRGTYVIKVVDPLLFIKDFVPQEYLKADSKMFDFDDMDNDAATQLFNDVVDSLESAFSIYANDPSRGNRMAKLQSDKEGFREALMQAVEESHAWKSKRGLEINDVTVHVEYDESSRELMNQAKEMDMKLSRETARGKAYSENMQGMMAGAVGYSMQTQAEGWKAAGEGMKEAGKSGSLESVGAGMFIGMGGQGQMNGGDALNAVNNIAANQPKTEDPTEKLLSAKKLLDAGAITQEDYDKIKAQILGL